MQSTLIVRPAESRDQAALTNLINYEYYLHRHLDWRTPTEWLGTRPFWVAERNGRLLAALAIPDHPGEVAWTRLFICASALNVNEAWEALFPACYQDLRNISDEPVTALALQQWFSDLLVKHSFVHQHDIVVLTWRDMRHEARMNLADGVKIRPLLTTALPRVVEVDAAAFQPVWRISQETMQRSLGQAAYSTVFLINDEIVGYQISTSTGMNAHLARLAVLPNLQRKRIGHALVQDLQQYFYHRGAHHLSVNTQSNNSASLALYQRAGFHLTGDQFPVFQYIPPDTP